MKMCFKVSQSDDFNVVGSLFKMFGTAPEKVPKLSLVLEMKNCGEVDDPSGLLIDENTSQVRRLDVCDRIVCCDSQREAVELSTLLSVSDHDACQFLCIVTANLGKNGGGGLGWQYFYVNYDSYMELGIILFWSNMNEWMNIN